MGVGARVGYRGVGGPQPGTIEGYGFLSDCRSAALVSIDGSVDWWCPAKFDAPSVFARILDPDAGHWSIAPLGAASVSRAYVGESLVLRTVWETDSGVITVTDALAFEPGARGHEIGTRSPRTLVRWVEGITGTVEVAMAFAPRMEYGRVTPHLVERDGGLEAVGGQVTLTLRTDLSLSVDGPAARATADFEVSAGSAIGFALSYRGTFDTERPAPLDPSASVADTVEAWTSWSDEHQEYEGAYRELVRHSAVVLQGLTYQRSGAVVAAATTSLPEELGGHRNYDYRYSWLRDFSFTMRSLWVAACPDESDRLLQSVASAVGQVGPHPVPVMYGIEGERELMEYELEHLDGFAASRPVRVGNAAWQQRQHDVLGEVIAAAYLLRDTVGRFGPETRALLVGLADKAVDDWAEPDAGMWEARDADRHYLSSKVMCWVATDLAVRLADDLRASAEDVDRWTRARDEIRAAVRDRGWNEEVGAYTGAFDSSDLDASVLVLPLVDFLPITDERMARTIDLIEDRLGDGVLIRRWDEDPAAFVLCSFWLAECRAMAGDVDRAKTIFDEVVSYASDLGLFAEQLDRKTGAHLGNTPQALSHIGLINAAWRIDGGSISTYVRLLTTVGDHDDRHTGSGTRKARGQGRTDHRCRLRHRAGHGSRVREGGRRRRGRLSGRP